MLYILYLLFYYWVEYVENVIQCSITKILKFILHFGDSVRQDLRNKIFTDNHDLLLDIFDHFIIG